MSLCLMLPTVWDKKTSAWGLDKGKEDFEIPSASWWETAKKKNSDEEIGLNIWVERSTIEDRPWWEIAKNK